jgi:hypothetical protein
VGCTLLWQSWMIFEKRPRQTCPFRERAVHIVFEACVRLAFHVGEGGPYVLRQRAAADDRRAGLAAVALWQHAPPQQIAVLRGRVGEHAPATGSAALVGFPNGCRDVVKRCICQRRFSTIEKALGRARRFSRSGRRAGRTVEAVTRPARARWTSSPHETVTDVGGDHVVQQPVRGHHGHRGCGHRLLQVAQQR